MKKKLQLIYDYFTAWAGEFDYACTVGCSTCCTQSVTMTTLEGELIIDFIRSSRPELLSLLANLPRNSIALNATTNQYAASCLRGNGIDEETPSSWDLSPCTFLREDRCTIYPVRSFMCRSFGSRKRCDISGTAEVDPLFLTLNTVFMQCIEHLDQGRPWGNMNMILRSLTVREEIGPQLIAQQIPGFLISPEEADKLHDKVRKLMLLLTRSI